MVLRRQSFAGHTLAVVGFPGAAGAVLVGVSATYGLLAFAVAAALVIGLVPVAGGRSYSEESAVTGTVQAFALACGFLFVVPLRRFPQRCERVAVRQLPRHQPGARCVLLLVVAAVALAGLAAIARPLLFASVDPDVAAGSRRPGARAVGRRSSCCSGSPRPRSARSPARCWCSPSWSSRPQPRRRGPRGRCSGLVLAVGIGVGVVWSSLFVAYFSPYPIGFFVTSVAFAVYLVAVGASRLRGSGWRGSGLRRSRA